MGKFLDEALSNSIQFGEDSGPPPTTLSSYVIPTLAVSGIVWWAMGMPGLNKLKELKDDLFVNNNTYCYNARQGWIPNAPPESVFRNMNGAKP